ncbi:unnamed protein product [[Candida] boidinii]|uniref:Unnamed protein product n=1 Tax=Candida boidinii TaxID=5477 RepID=A0A9W6W984_CANBO|nr:unnamed protein product [[Candida] boidinii]
MRKVPPAHLSEFYSYVNNTSSDMDTTNESIPDTSINTNNNNTNNINTNNSVNDISSTNVSSNYPSHPMNYHSYSGIDSRRGSFTTLNSASSLTSMTMDLPILITSKDFNEAVNCYQDLIKNSENYRLALKALSIATSEFSNSIENLARCKGSNLISDDLLNVSGLHYLIANQQQILSNTIQYNFEEPLKQHKDDFIKTYKKDEINFKSVINNKIKLLKKNENDNKKLVKLKTRNLITYKSNLIKLTNQLDEIDRLKHDYYFNIFEKFSNSANFILEKSCSIIKAELTTFENLSNKGKPGYGLDSLLNTIDKTKDPFNYTKDTITTDKKQIKNPILSLPQFSPSQQQSQPTSLSSISSSNSPPIIASSPIKNGSSSSLIPSSSQNFYTATTSTTTSTNGNNKEDQLDPNTSTSTIDQQLHFQNPIESTINPINSTSHLSNEPALISSFRKSNDDNNNNHNDTEDDNNTLNGVNKKFENILNIDNQLSATNTTQVTTSPTPATKTNDNDDNDESFSLPIVTNSNSFPNISSNSLANTIKNSIKKKTSFINEWND